MFAERAVKLYLVGTVSYGVCASFRRQHPPGLAATTVLAAPFIWPGLLAEDLIRHTNNKPGRACLRGGDS
jgi:hypothetical protein